MPPARYLLRLLRPSTPARVLGLFLVLVFLVGQWRWSRPKLTIDQAALAELVDSPREEIVRLYDDSRISEFERRQYDPVAVANEFGVPPFLPDGKTHSLDPGLDQYTARLFTFIATYFTQADGRRQMEDAVSRVLDTRNPKETNFPRNLYSTDHLGAEGVPELYRLWVALLPIALPPALARLLPNEEWAYPARKGGNWKEAIADDGQVEVAVPQWTGSSIADGKWGKLWSKLAEGEGASDVFRYLAVLANGGMFTDAETAPISHPYVWGLGAKSILHPDLEAISAILKLQENKAKEDSGYHGRVWERSFDAADSYDTAPLNKTDAVAKIVADIEARHSWHKWLPAFGADRKWSPAYPGEHRRVARAAIPQAEELDTPETATSILSPDINIIVGIDFDSSIAFDWTRILQWSRARFSVSWRRPASGRALQFSQRILASKPYHPILIDTLATVVELLKDTSLTRRQAIDVTGAGPYTDAVLRYLLVRYGVTPDQLQRLRGPVRVGDVLILQEQAYNAPESAMRSLLSHVQQFFPLLPGSGFAKAVKGYSLWYWGTGYESLRSGGTQVVYYDKYHTGRKIAPALDVDPMAVV
ncbi:hypothetical protein Q8F55_001047 [Vanrija albida]|uniref:Alpha-1,2-Mannosidase n=1 Tax=Vanrija albida TaxID=181172 RepID=A0ABR3QF05_9TREE